MGITSTQKMGVAALIMAGSVFLSRIMGLVRDKVVSWQFGAGAESDIYFTAFVVPDFLNHLLAGGYISITLIPLLAAAFKDDEADGWRFFGAVICWATACIAALTLIAWIAAPVLAPWIAPGFGAAAQARLVVFLRIILPAQVFFLCGACLSALLYIRRQFFVPALTPLMYNGCIIAGGLLLPGRGMEGFCWGVLAGAALGAFALPLWAVRRGGFCFTPGWRHRRLLKLALLALPLMLGLSVTVMDEQFVRIFGSMAGEGAVSLLNYARRIMMVPVGVVAQAAGVASFPFLAALAARHDDEAFADTLRRALRGSIWVVMPLTGVLMLLAGPILGFLFEGGRFSAAETGQAAPLLRIMLLAVPFWTVQQVLGRAFYARQDTLTPAVVGTLASLVALCVYPVLARAWGASGVALTATGSLALYTGALGAVWAGKHGGAVFAGAWRPLLVSGLLTALAVGAGWWALDTAGDALARLAVASAERLPVSAGVARHVLDMAVGGGAFVAVYAGIALGVAREALAVRRRG